VSQWYNFFELIKTPSLVHIDPMSFKQFITRKDSRLPDIISLLALLIFTAQGLYFTHHLDITMDEGTYLMKGVLFINGKYQPFQEYGPLTNKMPLAYLVPGAAQVILGPGLRTGRYFSVFLGALVVFGIWVAARRLGGRWWAAISTLILAASAANIMFYSLAISQGLTAALLTWSLALVLGKDRKLWELLVG
jgi:hypothetical protein